MTNYWIITLYLWPQFYVGILLALNAIIAANQKAYFEDTWRNEWVHQADIAGRPT